MADLTDEEFLHPEFDSDGYPTDKTLDLIRSWPHERFPDLFRYLREAWHYGDWGWTEKDGEYRISTGGWSGNESLIGAMEENRMFWMCCFWSQRRGGHFVFRLLECQGGPAWTDDEGELSRAEAALASARDSLARQSLPAKDGDVPQGDWTLASKLAYCLDPAHPHPVQFCQLVKENAEVILAALRPVVIDADVPVDEEWLVEMFGKYRQAKLGCEFYVQFYGWTSPELIHEYRIDGNQLCDSVDLPECKTRGDVRRLCAVLGIELKENR